MAGLISDDGEGSDDENDGDDGDGDDDDNVNDDGDDDADAHADIMATREGRRHPPLEQNVFGFEVAVHDARLAQNDEGIQELQEKITEAGQGKTTEEGIISLYI